MDRALAAKPITMFAILLSPNATLTIVSQLSSTFAELSHLNYTILFTGSRLACEAQLEELEMSAPW